MIVKNSLKFLVILIKWININCDDENEIGQSLFDEEDLDANFTFPFYSSSRYLEKRSIASNEDGFTNLNIGVLMASHLGKFGFNCIL